MMSPVRVVLDPESPKYQPFGNIRSENILRDFNRKDGKESERVKVLLLSCSDMRNTLEATSKFGIQNFVFHLNDCNPLNLARNIMILKIISESKFNPEDQADLNFLWDVWYNAKWPEHTRIRFMVVLKDLLDNKLPENVTVAVTNGDLSKLQNIWASWHLTCSKNGIELNMLMNDNSKERALDIVQTLLNQYPTFSQRGKSFDQIFCELTNKYAVMWEGNLGTTDLNDRIREKIRQEALHFDKEGLCQMEKENNVCVNPTFLHPTTLRWIVLSSGFPFDGYFPLRQNEELDTSIEEKMLIRFCQAKLKSFLSSYRQRVNDVKIFFHLGDDFEFCYNATVEQFDVVYCSNISDHAGLPNVINAGKCLLVDSAEAMVLTQSIYWMAKATSVKSYIEKELCCPLSMIPTMYGLRLLNRVELGSLVPDGLRSPYSHMVTLCWKKVPKFKNISLSPSPAINSCLEKLIERCFSVNGPRLLEQTDGVKEFNWAYFTPNTFNFMVDSISQRVDIDRCVNKLKFPRAFDMTRRTTEAWKNGQTVFKFSTKELNTPLELCYIGLMKVLYGHIEGCTRNLRLILTPSNTELKTCLERNLVTPQNFQGIISGPDVHFIDNFHLEMLKNTEGETSSAKVSFLLPWDHCLIKPYSGLIFDLGAGFPIIIFESIKNLNVQKFHLPYPFRSQRDKSSGKFHMKIDDCIESEDGYTLKISTTCAIPNGMSVYTLRKLPCDSIHDVPIGLNEPSDPKPLVLSFPYPVLIDKIHATVHHKDRLIDLVLKKALLEPWPEDFDHKHSMWNPDSLKPWKNGVGLNSMKNHIYSQRLPHSLESELLIMSMVRSMIYNVFLKLEETKKEVYLSIRLKGAPATTGTYWVLRAHPPILTSPQGSPLILVSAMDVKQPQERKNIDKAQKDLHRIFSYNVNSENALMMIGTAEELEFIRFVLRLNSTKIAPTEWQKTNLQLGDDKPFLATFISPLYFDVPMSNQDYDKLLGKCGLPPSKPVKCALTGAIVDENCCSNCMKTSANLKRCGKCRAVLYCNVECQRLHWPQHKTVCKSLKEAMSKVFYL